MQLCQSLEVHVSLVRKTAWSLFFQLSLNFNSASSCHTAGLLCSLLIIFLFSVFSPSKIASDWPHQHNPWHGFNSQDLFWILWIFLSSCPHLPGFRYLVRWEQLSFLYLQHTLLEKYYFLSDIQVMSYGFRQPLWTAKGTSGKSSNLG